MINNAHEAKWIYDELGINLSTLGCIMANMTPPEIDIPTEFEYHTKNPERFWIKGVVTDKAHVTLKYGLLPGVKKTHVDEVLKGWGLSDVYMKEVMVFDSPYSDESYKCIVMAMESDSLSEANALLSMLPNVSTFKNYVPHLTVAYVKEEHVDEAVQMIKQQMHSYHPRFIGLDYGGRVN